MQDYYKVLLVDSSASNAEIRRAYRDLARKYHPDLNPGGEAEEFFKEISAAYYVLSDPERRRRYDAELKNSGNGHTQATRKRSSPYRYDRRGRASSRRTRERRARDQSAASSSFSSQSGDQTAHTSARHQAPPGSEAAQPTAHPGSTSSLFSRASATFRRFVTRLRGSQHPVSVVEILVSVEEAINGVKKVIELDESTAKRKISVRIPPGVRTGSVVHLQSRRKQREELVVIIRVAPHPYISMHVKGLVVEIPITIQEAVEGARIQVPTLEEPALITVPAGSQSGHEIRLRSRGPVGRDGVRSDLFYRLLIKVPDQPFASGLAGKVREVSAYYEEAVRRTLPQKLFQSS